MGYRSKGDLPMLIIGELINSTRKTVRKAIEKRDSALIQDLARRQVEAGADWLDVNAGAFADDEIDHLSWLIDTIREVSPSPLCIDSPRPEALEAGLSLAGDDPFVNSITAEKERYRRVIPLVRKFRARVITLSLDDSGMTDDAEKVYGVAEGLIKRLQDDGVPSDRIYIDPLIKPLSTNSQSAVASLGVLDRLSQSFPEVHKTCGLSNVSFGLPKRRLINQTFVVMCMLKGLDAVIVDPLDRRMMAQIVATEALLGRDDYCLRYIEAERQGILDVV
jgi:5-methyltetrahydrofolate--homocysteine methyltransferase